MTSNWQISICKVCFKEIQVNSFLSLLRRDLSICEHCFASFTPRFIHFNEGGVKGLAIYQYDDIIKQKLYELKGCYDLELAPIFLDYFKFYLKFKYKNHILIPIPSWKEDDLMRGFNHVVEIFKTIGLPIKGVLIKTSAIKQSQSNYQKRQEIHKYMDYDNSFDIRNKHVLLVDDVLTTGSSMKAAINLLNKYHPKSMTMLVVSKTKEEQNNP